jgi:cytochrome c-type biogenesis protein CcsB
MKTLFAFILALICSTTLFAQPSEFAKSVDMSPLSDNVAVFTDGRVKSFETFARSYMPYIMGSKSFEGQAVSFTYFDMMILPERYYGQDIIYVKHKGLRAAIIGEVDITDPQTKERMDRFMKTGLVSREVLQSQTVSKLLNSLRKDVRRFATPIEGISGAMGASDPRSLWGSLKLIPPPSGSFNQPWSTLEGAEDQNIIESWRRLTEAWQDGNADEVNVELKQLAVLIPALAKGSDIYPSPSKLWLESIYFRMGNFTSIWLVYLVSVVLLLMAFVYRFKRVGNIGLFIFTIAVLLNTLAVVWRWYVSGRYPNTNMFEAITTAAWMGGVFGVFMECFVRKTAMKYIFALGSGIAAMVALLAVRLYPLELNPQVSNKMPVLHDIWLYIHVNFIIFAYCLIFVAAVCAIIYLIRRIVQKTKHQNGKQDYARAGGVASLVEVRPDKKGGTTPALKSNMGSVLDGATMILVELSFILLWAGIVMGAIWADHSWGRPWGWDPKEVFALNTFLIFVVLIHARIKVQDKGLWTAWLALLGCAVMLFNWIIINFTISGLHSYA